MTKRIIFLILSFILIFSSFSLIRPGSEAERFFRSFVDSNELSTNENGELIYTDKNYAEQRNYNLKYADVLSFNEYQRFDIEITDINGGELKYDITNISSFISGETPKMI